MRNLMKAGGIIHQLLIKTSTAPRTVTLAEGVTRVGRDPASDICLEDSTVSGCHCEIVVEREAVFVRDLGSTNGTTLEGRPVQETALLPGQTLRVGAVEVVLEQPVEISIPELVFAQETHPLMPDGFAACLNHPAAYATVECPQCQKVFCEICVHQIRRVGGAPLQLCPSCGGHCRTLQRVAPEKQRQSRFGTWISKVTAKMTGRMVRSR